MCWNAPPPRLVAGWLNWSMPTETDEKSKRDSQLCNQNCTVQPQFSVTAGPTWLPEGQWQLVTGTWGGKAGWRRGHEQGKGLYRFTVLHSDLDSGFGEQIASLSHQLPPAPHHSISELSLTCCFHSTVCSTFWWALFCMEIWAQSCSCCLYPLHSQQLSIATASCEIWCKQHISWSVWLVLARGPWGDCGKSVH